jgi:hypothetical protein
MNDQEGTETWGRTEARIFRRDPIPSLRRMIHRDPLPSAGLEIVVVLGERHWALRLSRRFR